MAKPILIVNFPSPEPLSREELLGIKAHILKEVQNEYHVLGGNYQGNDRPSYEVLNADKLTPKEHEDIIELINIATNINHERQTN